MDSFKILYLCNTTKWSPKPSYYPSPYWWPPSSILPTPQCLSPLVTNSLFYLWVCFVLFYLFICFVILDSMGIHFNNQNYLSLFRNLTENKWLKSYFKCGHWTKSELYRSNALMVTEADKGRRKITTKTLKLRLGIHLWSKSYQSNKSVWSSMIILLQKPLKSPLSSFSLPSVLDTENCLNI